MTFHPSTVLATVTILEEMLEHDLDEAATLVTKFALSYGRTGDLPGLVDAYVTLAALVAGFMDRGLDDEARARWRHELRIARVAAATRQEPA